MEATGLKKGGIYRHFSSKEELAAEAFDYAWEAAWNARLLHVDEKANGIEKLKQLIANFVEHRSPVAGGCPILNTAIDADDGNPVLSAHVAKAVRSWLSRLQTIVDQQIEQMYLEDLRVGQKFTSGTYVMEAVWIKEFAAEFDPQPFHLD